MISLNKKLQSRRAELQKQHGRLDIFTNFKHYGLTPPEVVRMDSINSLFRSASPLFDSIVCDPPYGIRAPQKITKQSFVPRKGRDQQREKQSVQKFYDPEFAAKGGRKAWRGRTEPGSADSVDPEFVIGTETTDTGNIVDKLFEFARGNLQVDGRLVFLYPESPRK